MKYILTFRLTLIIILLITQFNTSAQQTIQFDITLKNTDSADFWIGTIGDMFDPPVSLANQTVTNHFILNIPLHSPVEASVMGLHIYLEPGNKYKLEYDAKSSKSSLSGKNAGNYLCWERIKNDSIVLKKYTEYEGQEIWLKQQLKLNMLHKLRVLDSLWQSGTISKSCYQYVRNETYYSYLAKCKTIITSLNLDPYGPVARELLKDYTSSLFANSARMKSKFYRATLYTYASYLLANNRKFEYNTERFSTLLHIIQKKFTNPQKDYLLVNLFNAYALKMSVDIPSSIDSFYQPVRQALTTPKYRHLTDSIYQYYSKVNQPVPNHIQNISVFNLNKDTISFSGMLREAGEKNLLIEFWASWCGPCIAQIREFNSQKHRVDTGKYSILFISIDENENKYRAAVNTLGISSYLLSQPSVELFKSYFNLRGIPRGIMIKNEKVTDLDYQFPMIYN